MKLVIAGSRNIKLTPVRIMALISHFNIVGEDPIKQIVSGGAAGMDKSGEEFAKMYMAGLEEPIKQFLPDRERYAGRAYHIRNKKMAAYGDKLLLVWDGESDGSKDMKRAMFQANKPIYEIIMRTYNLPEKKDE